MYCNMETRNWWVLTTLWCPFSENYFTSGSELGNRKWILLASSLLSVLYDVSVFNVYLLGISWKFTQNSFGYSLAVNSSFGKKWPKLKSVFRLKYLKVDFLVSWRIFKVLLLRVIEFMEKRILVVQCRPLICI